MDVDEFSKNFTKNSSEFVKTFQFFDKIFLDFVHFKKELSMAEDIKVKDCVTTLYGSIKMAVGLITVIHGQGEMATCYWEEDLKQKSGAFPVAILKKVEPDFTVDLPSGF